MADLVVLVGQDWAVPSFCESSVLEEGPCLAVRTVRGVCVPCRARRKVLQHLVPRSPRFSCAVGVQRVRQALIGSQAVASRILEQSKDLEVALLGSRKSRC
jgi:hypothetical protein